MMELSLACQCKPHNNCTVSRTDKGWNQVIFARNVLNLGKNPKNNNSIHPNLDLVNEPVRSLLFTKSNYLLNRGGVYSKICMKGAGVCLLNRGIY